MVLFAAIVQFPEPSRPVIVAMLVVFASMFVGSVVYEYNRKRSRRKHRLASEWRAVRTIVHERGLADDSAERMLGLLEKYASNSPLQAATSRSAFNKIVEAAINEARKSGPLEELQTLGESLRTIRVQLGLNYIPVGQQIFSTRDLHQGQWISIKKAGEKEKRFRIVVELVNEAFFYAQPHSPTEETAPELRPGDTLECRMWRDEDGRYLFETVVVETERSPLRWKLAHSTELNRTQSREHFRVRHDQSVTVSILNAPADGNYTDASSRKVVTRIPGRITSISAGGLAIVTEQAVTRQVLLRIPLKLSGLASMEVQTRIVACDLLSAGRYLVRVAFVALDEEHQEYIVKFISRHQQAILAPENESE